MQSYLHRYRRMDLALASACCFVAAPAFGGEDWVTYNNETSTRMVSNPSVGAADTQEKDYTWGDVDQDGWTDLIVVRKQPFTVGTQGRSNVLFMNIKGVLTDQTAQWMPDFLDEIEDRDVALVDVDNDGWDDIVTAAACNSACNPGGFSDDSRLYMNLGEDGGGNWLGYGNGIVLVGGGNNFCAVAAGDIDNDGYADLYFVSYNDSFEDQLLMNGGPDNPGVFTVENNRLTSAMRASGFGTNAVIIDMNGDGWADIVKSENGPVEIFRNAQDGTFDLLDPTYGGAAYHVGVGDLDGNGTPDLVISDDGTDRYILNPVLDGAPDTSFAFPGSTGGFGSNSVIADLDDDGFNEVLIADVDVDVSGCTRVSDILRASSGPSFVSDSANIPDSMLQGVHDIAVFDINNDGQLDIVVGRCSGTQVWINSQTVISVTFEYPGGIPQFITPDETTKLIVEINAFGDTLMGTPTIFISPNKGAFVETTLDALGGGMYSVNLPAGQCSDRIDFYFNADLTGGLSFTDPATAPVTWYTSISALGTQNLIDDTLEGDTSDWTVVNDGTLTGGAWEAADPNATLFAGVAIAAPGDDATPGAGTIAFVTENGPAGNQTAELWDVDGGPTTLFSPAFDLSGTDGIISFARWSFSKDGSHDSLETHISNDGGSNWTLVEEAVDTGSSWQTKTFIVSDFVAPTSQMQMRFRMSDDDDSVSEAGIDDFRVDTLACSVSCLWDIAGPDGEVGINDFLDLLAAWGPNPGHPADFDDDGVVGINDFLELLANWGPCP